MRRLLLLPFRGQDLRVLELVPGEARTDQDQGRGLLRVCDPEVDRDAPAERHPDQHRPLELQRVDQRLQVGFRRVGLGPGLAQAVRARIVPHDAEPLRPLEELRVPHPPVEQAAVQQDERAALPGVLVVEPCPVGLDEAGADGGGAGGSAGSVAGHDEARKRRQQGQQSHEENRARARAAIVRHGRPLSRDVGPVG